MEGTKRLAREQAAAVVDDLFSGDDSETLLPFLLASFRVAWEKDDDRALVVAVFPEHGPPFEYLRLWLGPTNVIRTYGPGRLYAVLDTRKLEPALLEQLRSRGQVEEDGDAYKSNVPSSIGVALTAADIAANRHELFVAHRRHIAEAAGKRGQFGVHHQPALSAYLRQLANDTLPA